MIVEDAVNIKNKYVAFGGTCENRYNFKNKSRLIDDLGNIYNDVYMAVFVKYLDIDYDNSQIIDLLIKQNIDPKKLIGRTLTEYPDN